MIAAFEEVTGGEQAQGTGSKVDDTEFGQQMLLQYDALDLFDYGEAPPPLSLSYHCAPSLCIFAA